MTCRAIQSSEFVALIWKETDEKTAKSAAKNLICFNRLALSDKDKLRMHENEQEKPKKS